MQEIDKYNEITVAITTSVIFFFAICSMVILILIFYQKKRIFHKQQITDMEKQFSDVLLKSQLEIQEQTLNHISQEIHDNVGQILSLGKVQANIVLETGNLAMVADLKDNIGKALTDLRDMAKSLSSERLLHLSIIEAVTLETERINKIGTIHASIGIQGEEQPIDEQKKQILFRILQECLQNVIKHAAATTLHLQFNYTAGLLEVLVKDDGRGFDVPTAMKVPKGLGLQNIKTRISIIGGSFAIESNINTGSTLILKIPHG
jgi:two-component system, NarL family, sensor kinase